MKPEAVLKIGVGPPQAGTVSFRPVLIISLLSDDNLKTTCLSAERSQQSRGQFNTVLHYTNWNATRKRGELWENFNAALSF